MSTWPNRGASGGPCGGLGERKSETNTQSGQPGLTQANRPPRNPVRFRAEQWQSTVLRSRRGRQHQPAAGRRA